MTTTTAQGAEVNDNANLVYGTSASGGGYNSIGGLTHGSQYDQFDKAATRFLNVAVPKGATITSASVTLFDFGAKNFPHQSTCDIYGRAVDNSPTLASWSSESTYGPLTTAKTTAAVWYAPAAQAGSSNDVTAIVQEIINRPGWVSGNALAVVLNRNDVSTGSTASSFGATDAGNTTTGPPGWPTLTVSYTANAPYVTGAPQSFAFTASGTTVTYTGGGIADSTTYDVLCVNSDNVVVTPAGWSVLTTRVNGQGSYIFAKQGGTSSAVIDLGNNVSTNTTAFWTRITNVAAVDVVAVAGVDSSNGTSTPAVSTATLAGSNDLSLAFAAIHSMAVTPASPVWSSGYAQVSVNSSGTGSTATWGSVAVKTPAGALAESPSVTWTNVASDRYILVATFAPAVGVGGPVTHNATATMGGTGGLAATAAGPITATATTAGTGTLTGAASLTKSATASAAGVGGLTGAASVIRSATASLAGAGSLAGSATRVRFGAATASGVGGLSGAASVTRPGAATASATGTLSAAATVSGSGATGDLSGTGGMTATGSASRNATVAAAGIGGLAATGAVTRQASAIAGGAGGLTANASVSGAGTNSTLTGTGGLAATGTAVRSASGTANATGALVAAGLRIAGGFSATAGTGTLTGTAIVVRVGIGSAVGVGGLSAEATVVRSATASFASASDLVAVSADRRRPGVLTAGTTRSRLVAGALPRPRYITGHSA